MCLPTGSTSAPELGMLLWKTVTPGEPGMMLLPCGQLRADWLPVPETFFATVQRKPRGAHAVLRFLEELTTALKIVLDVIRWLTAV